MLRSVDIEKKLTRDLIIIIIDAKTKSLGMSDSSSREMTTQIVSNCEECDQVNIHGQVIAGYSHERSRGYRVGGNRAGNKTPQIKNCLKILRRFSTVRSQLKTCERVTREN